MSIECECEIKVTAVLGGVQQCSAECNSARQEETSDEDLNMAVTEKKRCKYGQIRDSIVVPQIQW